MTHYMISTLIFLLSLVGFVCPAATNEFDLPPLTGVYLGGSLSGENWLEIARGPSWRSSELRKRLNALNQCSDVMYDQDVLQNVMRVVASKRTLISMPLASKIERCQGNTFKKKLLSFIQEGAAHFVANFQTKRYMDMYGMREEYRLAFNGLETALVLIKLFIQDMPSFEDVEKLNAEKKELEDQFKIACICLHQGMSLISNNKIIAGYGPGRFKKVRRRERIIPTKEAIALALDAPWHAVGILKGVVDVVRGTDEGFAGGWSDMVLDNPLSLTHNVSEDMTKWKFREVEGEEYVKGAPIYRDMQTEEEFKKCAEKRMGIVACTVTAINLCLEQCAKILSIIDNPTMQRVISSPESINECGETGKPPIIEMLEQGNDLAVEILAEMGANVNVCDGDGQTPLHVAARIRKKQLLRTIISKSTGDIKRAKRSRDREGRIPHYWSLQDEAQGHLTKELTSEKVSLDDIAGYGNLVTLLCSWIDQYEQAARGEIDPNELKRAILLFGVPGNGKTTIAQAIANETGIGFLEKEATKFVGRYAGDGPRNVTAVFDEARAIAEERGLCILFLDEIDAVGAIDREDSRTPIWEKKTLNQVLTEMQGFRKELKVIVIAATNVRDALDTALCRRFDEKLEIGLPNSNSRAIIVQHYLRSFQRVMLSEEDFQEIARKTEGYSCSALMLLVKSVIERVVNGKGDSDAVTYEDFNHFFDQRKPGENPDRAATRSFS